METLKILNTIKCLFGKHCFYGELEPSYQALNDDGINYECKCIHCGCKGIAKFRYGLDFSTIDKKVISNYINDTGIIIRSKR